MYKIEKLGFETLRFDDASDAARFIRAHPSWFATDKRIKVTGPAIEDPRLTATFVVDTTITRAELISGSWRRRPRCR